MPSPPLCALCRSLQNGTAGLRTNTGAKVDRTHQVAVCLAIQGLQEFLVKTVCREI